MQVSPEQGQFLAQLAMLTGAQRYLEIGVYTGYSSLAVARVLPEGGLVVALDRDEVAMGIARRYWEEGGVREVVEERIGCAQETLAEVAAEYGPGSFDLAFIGALFLCSHLWGSLWVIFWAAV
jgi:O-methyltransferase